MSSRAAHLLDQRVVPHILDQGGTGSPASESASDDPISVMILRSRVTVLSMRKTSSGFHSRVRFADGRDDRGVCVDGGTQGGRSGSIDPYWMAAR